MSNQGSPEQSAMRDSGGAPTQHAEIPNAFGPGGMQEYFLRRAQATGLEPAPDPADDGGQPEAQEREASQRDGGPPTSEQPEPIGEQPESDSEEYLEASEEPDSEDGEGLVIDGQRFTPEDVRQLIRERDEAGLRQDDYTRKSQYLSRVRQEHEALNEQFEGLGETFAAKERLLGEVIMANLRQLESVDTRQLSADQYEAYKVQLATAQQGVEALSKKFDELDAMVSAKRTEAEKRKARATREMLRWSEPRWDDQNQFYGQLREFSVREGLMSEAQFDRETDFLRLKGLIAIMDADAAPKAITEAANEQRPPRRSRNRQRNQQGQFQKGREAARQNVLSSTNARKDGSFRAMLQANLAAEGEKRR